MSDLEKRSDNTPALQGILARGQRFPLIPTLALWRHPDAQEAARWSSMSAAGLGVGLGIMGSQILAGSAPVYVQVLLASTVALPLIPLILGALEPGLRRRLRAAE